MVKNKVVYSACFGGYGISTLALETYYNRKGIEYVRVDGKSEYGSPNISFFKPEVYNSLKYKHLAQLEWQSLPIEDRQYLNAAHIDANIERHDPIFVQVVEELGTEASSTRHAQLEIAEIEGNKYRIDEYDGSESVETPDDISWEVIEGRND